MNILKFNIIRQKDAMQCGVACLAMICRHFGADYSLEIPIPMVR
ncbi:MAG: hypothetical protein K2N79_04145 [Muribaculaceae bacterium]|nr:hypothetical protein [Muribaculaceae bacterium]MDE7370095.1 hypothetical protein [Muribaculaceae bacterium]